MTKDDPKIMLFQIIYNHCVSPEWAHHHLAVYMIVLLCIEFELGIPSLIACFIIIKVKSRRDIL